MEPLLVDRSKYQDTGVVFLGGARYTCPLDATDRKKFQMLTKLGSIFVIAFSTDMKPYHFRECAYFYLLPNLPVRMLRYALVFALGPILTLWCVLHHNAHILIAQEPYVGAVMAGVKILVHILGLRVVLVVECHGDFEKSVFLQHRIRFSRLYRFFMDLMARFTFRQADLLRSISSTTWQQLERWVPDKPQFQFATWTDIDVFFQSSSNQAGARPPSILYAGVLTPLKGIHHLIRAFAQLAQEFPQVELVLVGQELNKPYVTELKSQIQRLGLNGRVQFVGQVSQSELAMWMSHASVLVLPSYSEGLGRVVVEAMATGTPVIGSDVGGIPDMIEDQVTGFLVSPGDEIALAERLRWVLMHPRAAQTMGERGRTFAEHFCSTETYIQGWEEIFRAARCLRKQPPQE